MELIKKKISLESARSRAEGPNYGQVTASTFYFKVQLSQTMDTMGVFTDFPFIPAPYINRELDAYEKTIRPSGARVDNWYEDADRISGFTDSKLETLETYNLNSKYIVGFDIEKENYVNHQNQPVIGVSRVTNINGNNYTYAFDANNDLTIGTTAQTTGILYKDSVTTDGFDYTTMSYDGQGWNGTNTSLSAITKEEYLMGIIYPPEVKSDVFIDRGRVTVMESHLRLSEVESLDHLERYGNGFYNIIKV